MHVHSPESRPAAAPAVPPHGAHALAPASRQADADTSGLAPHSSHTRATEFLAPYRDALGPAYALVHLLARWSVEHATSDDPAPHLLTTYWSLEEATGKCARTLMRHLVEPGHPWSEAVRHLVDVRHNYGAMPVGSELRPCIVGTVIRFFPAGRHTPSARVCAWGRRDLIAESDAGRTRPCRPRPGRYERRVPRMSAYTSVKEQAVEFNWVMIQVGRPLEMRQHDSIADLYADIPDQHVLNALRGDLVVRLGEASRVGKSLKRVRARWVEQAATTLAHRFGDDVPKPHRAFPVPRDGIHGYRFHNGKAFPVPADGFTSLWRRALWTAVRAEEVGVPAGWWFVERFCTLAAEAGGSGKTNPVAWAWTVVKLEGFAEVMRDHAAAAVPAGSSHGRPTFRTGRAAHPVERVRPWRRGAGRRSHGRPARYAT